MHRLIKDFLQLLKKLNQSKVCQFSGIGLVLYQHIDAIKNYHCNLVNDKKTIPSLKLGGDELIKYLLEISSTKHPYHDGFHFIDGTGTLTHVAQFFSPPIDHIIPNVNGQGARTLCALYGSKLSGVLMIGTVSSNNEIFLFNGGQVVHSRGVI